MSPIQADLTDAIALQQEHGHAHVDRDTTIKTLRAALRRRSGRAWSVTGGRGTGWGWITITAPPARRIDSWHMTERDCAELGELLSLGRPTGRQGVSVPASSDYYIEHIARAEGRAPTSYGVPYWD